jgi:hypothetical protein
MSEIIALPAPPESYYRENDMWLDEQIWGHRLYDGQDPWLLFLEFLSVAEACHADGRLLTTEDPPFPFTYRPAKRPYLRNLLYNNDKISEIANRHPDDETAWAKWLSWMQDNAQMVENRDFSYLKKRFRSFRQFVKVIEMIRTATIESGSNKRWSSRFVFPFGTHAIYEDLNVKGGREYIYFTRNGELLYQMLARSGQSDELAGHFAKLLERRDPCDRLVELLQPERTDDRENRSDSYLPYAKHPAFESLAEDWLSVLQLHLPRFDAYPHLSFLGALHLSLYQLAVAADLCGERKPHFVCEVVAPRKTLIRELSATSYLHNNQLSQLAVEHYIRALSQTSEWQTAAHDSAGFATCLGILRGKVRWPRKPDDYTGPAQSEELLDHLRAAALRRHRQHPANVHRALGGGAGLVSRRGTNRLRYAPTDDLLKALIFANVPVRMEYGQFLARLYDRYGLIFGDREAHIALATEDFDKRAFQANAKRLENRLKTIGMLRKLSDACAYVENPLRRHTA